MRFLLTAIGRSLTIGIVFLAPFGIAKQIASAGDNQPSDIGGARQIRSASAKSEPQWLQTLLGGGKKKAYAETVRIVLDGPQIGDADLVHLAEFTSLKDLSINRTSVTDTGLAHLKPLRNLQSLSLWENRITEKGLVHLDGLTNLKKLFFAFPLGDQGLSHIGRLTNLEEFGFWPSPVVPIPEIFKTSVVEPTYQISDAGLRHLRGMTALKKLDLSGMHVTNAGLVALSRLPRLELLNLSGTQIDDAGIEHLGALPLISLILADTKIGDIGLGNLSSIGLSLDLSGT